MHHHLYFTTTYARLGLFVIGRPRVQLSPSAPTLDGSNSFRVFLVEARGDFQRAKSLAFSVTSVAPACVASTAISRSRKWRTKSICPYALRARRSRMPASIHAAEEGDEK